MSMPRMTMERLQELVRLHRKGIGCKERARLLKMGPNTERQYRLVLEKAGLLVGSEFELPALEELKNAIQEALPQKRPGQQKSSISKWKEDIKQMYEMGSGPQAISGGRSASCRREPRSLRHRPCRSMGGRRSRRAARQRKPWFGISFALPGARSINLIIRQQRPILQDIRNCVHFEAQRLDPCRPVGNER